MPLQSAARALLGLAVLSACTAQPETRPVDSQRARLLAALPDDALERGVYLFEGDVSEELSPGSLLAPIIGSLIPQADLIVETGAPPVTLLSGLDEDVNLPERMARVDGVAVLGSDEDVAAVREALGEGSGLIEPLPVLADSSAPVGWAGPLPGCEPGSTADLSEGSLTVALAETLVELSVAGRSAQDLESVVDGRLETEGPAHSPGKPWRSILADHAVRMDGELLVIEAVPVDLPGGLLRQLLDTRGLSFLRPTDC
ncbi:MAG: hypothetical protein ACRDHM_07005 [Actinomycetota bacterium]